MKQIRASYSGLSLCVAVSVSATGCVNVAKQLGGPPPLCAEGRSVTKTGQLVKPLDAATLVRYGRSYISQGLAQANESNSRIYPVDVTVEAARCFNRALQLAPDNYSANLGLAISYIARARTTPKRDPKFTALVTPARRLLGKAYAIRQGALEPMYYLAEIEVLEERYPQAEAILKVLEGSVILPGPVYTLLGYVSDEQGKRTEAKEYYQKALDVGWPPASVDFAARKVSSGRRGGRSR